MSQADITAYSNSIDKDIYAIASINNSIKNLGSGNIKKIKDFSYKKIHLVTGIASTDEIISTLNNNKIQYPTMLNGIVTAISSSHVCKDT